MDCCELEELGEVVTGGEDQDWQDVPDERSLIRLMVNMPSQEVLQL